jgi:hypothetical protein
MTNSENQQSNVDELVEIPQHDLLELKNKFKNDWPNHIMAYYLLENYLHWLDFPRSNEQFKIYNLNGDWKTNATFIIIVSFFQISYFIQFQLF